MDINSYISSGIIEMYVMGLCSPEEKNEMESLRIQYPQLNNAVLEYEKAFENNLMAAAAVPGDEADKKILQLLHSLQVPVVDIDTAPAYSKTKNSGWIRAVAAAAIILFILSSIFNYRLYKKTNELQLALHEKENYSPLPITDYNILKDRTITPVAMYGVAPHSICRCTMFWDKKTGKVYIMIHHLPASSQNNYQLWAMVDNKPMSVGIINDAIRDRFIEMQNMPAGATSFIVTLEKKGGSITPTVEETYLSGRI